MTASWIEQTSSASWSARAGLWGIGLPDESVVVGGGYTGSSLLNDVYRSTDYGKTWSLQTSSAAWSPRVFSRVVVMPNGDIILTGGLTSLSPSYVYSAEVWRSSDMGATWSLLTGAPGWLATAAHGFARLPNGDLFICATGADAAPWKSSNGGTNWSQLSGSPSGAYDRCMSLGVTASGALVQCTAWTSFFSGACFQGYYTRASETSAWVMNTAGGPASGSVGLTDPISGYAVFFGGESCGGVTPGGNTWSGSVIGTFSPYPTWSGRGGLASMVTPLGVYVVAGGNSQRWSLGISPLNDVWAVNVPVSSVRRIIDTRFGSRVFHSASGRRTTGIYPGSSL